MGSKYFGGSKNRADTWASSSALDPYHNHVISLFFILLIYRWLRPFFFFLDRKTVTMVDFSITVVMFYKMCTAKHTGK